MGEAVTDAAEEDGKGGVEVTFAMIDAGIAALALWGYGNEGGASRGIREQAVVEVFEAMRRARVDRSAATSSAPLAEPSAEAPFRPRRA